MTTLTKDETLRLARECNMSIPDVMYADEVSFKQLAAFAHLCRADSVVEVERLKGSAEANDAAITWATTHIEQIISERDALRAEVERLKADPVLQWIPVYGEQP